MTTPQGGDEIVFDNAWPVVCTEKDYIKIKRLDNIPHNCWYLQVEACMDPSVDAQLAQLLAAHGIHVVGEIGVG